MSGLQSARKYDLPSPRRYPERHLVNRAKRSQRCRLPTFLTRHISQKPCKPSQAPANDTRRAPGWNDAASFQNERPATPHSFGFPASTPASPRRGGPVLPYGLLEAPLVGGRGEASFQVEEAKSHTVGPVWEEGLFLFPPCVRGFIYSRASQDGRGGRDTATHAAPSARSKFLEATQQGSGFSRVLSAIISNGGKGQVGCGSCKGLQRKLSAQ